MHRKLIAFCTASLISAALPIAAQSSRPSAQYDDKDIILSNGTTNVWYDFPNNPALTWTHYATVLDDTGGWQFGAFASPTPATAAQIQAVLANLTELQIRGEFRTGADTASLDNVNFTPEPSCALLTLIATFRLASRKVSRRSSTLPAATAPLIPIS